MTSTSVRVALRVRPLNSKEALQNCNECLTIITDAPQILIGTDRSLTFDYVFPSDTKQKEVFQDYTNLLIENQTDSSKTHSMGIALDGSNIPPYIKEYFVIHIPPSYLICSLNHEYL